MPERKITEEQREQIRTWAMETKQGKPVYETLEWPRVSDPHAAILVDGEPLFVGRILPVVESFENGVRELKFDSSNFGSFVACTYRQALELQQAGIVNFTEKLEQGAKTP